MRYCLDSNVHIEAHRRYYAFDIAPGFSEGLIRLAKQQMICSPIFVYDEIKNSDDELAQWARSNKDILFVEVDDTTQMVLREIADQVTLLYEPHHVQKFLAGADPWVIAYAKAHQLSVVTMESWRHETVDKGKISGRIKVPNICQRSGVTWEDTFALLRKQGVVLR